MREDTAVVSVPITCTFWVITGCGSGNPVSVVWPVPPLAAARVPASVMVPDDVMGPPEVVKPVVPPDTATEVTVPEPGVTVEEIVMPPAEFEIEIPEPCVIVASAKPDPLPISNWPFVGVADRPVPPFATGVMFAASSLTVPALFLK